MITTKAKVVLFKDPYEFENDAGKQIKGEKIKLKGTMENGTELVYKINVSSPNDRILLEQLYEQTQK